MKHYPILTLLAFCSAFYSAKAQDTLYYSKTQIVLPAGCPASSEQEIKDCHGFTAQWTYLSTEMLEQDIERQLYASFEKEFKNFRRTNFEFKSQQKKFKGFKYQLKDGTCRILGVGKVEAQWLFLHLGFKKEPRRNRDLSKLALNFIEFK